MSTGNAGQFKTQCEDLAAALEAADKEWETQRADMARLAVERVEAVQQVLTPLSNWLLTPELQWQSRGKRGILQG